MRVWNHLQQRLRDGDVVGVVSASLGSRLRRGVGDGQHGVGRAGDGDDAVAASVCTATDHDADDGGGGLREVGSSVSSHTLTSTY